MERLCKLVRWGILVLAVTWAGWEAFQAWQTGFHWPTTAAVDFPPLWAGAQAIQGGENPTDPEILRRIMDESGTRMHRGTLFSYYPPTASVLFLPLAHVGWRTSVLCLRWVLLGAVIGTAVLGAGSGSTPGHDRRSSWTAAMVACGLLLHLRLVPIVIRTGQVSPLVTLAMAAGLWALSRGWGRRAGVFLGLGAGLKLVPLLLLPVALVGRRWQPFLAAVGVFGLLALLAWWLCPDAPFLGEVGAFLDRGWFPEWGRQAAWIVFLWKIRFFLGIPTALVLMALSFRHHSDAILASAGMVILAWVGTVMAGTPHYHEALLLTPVLAWIVAGPWHARPRWVGLGTAIAVLAILWWTGALRHQGPRAGLEWVAGGSALWLASILRLGMAWREEVASNAPTGQLPDP